MRQCLVEVFLGGKKGDLMAASRVAPRTNPLGVHAEACRVFSDEAECGVAVVDLRRKDVSRRLSIVDCKRDKTMAGKEHALPFDFLFGARLPPT